MIASIPRTQTPRLDASLPEIIFEAARLDDGVHVLIVDHPSRLHVVVDDRDMTQEAAESLTRAVRENITKGNWLRLFSAIMTTED
jgi:hypothetical protein